MKRTFFILLCFSLQIGKLVNWFEFCKINIDWLFGIVVFPLQIPFRVLFSFVDSIKECFFMGIIPFHSFLSFPFTLLSLSMLLSYILGFFWNARFYSFYFWTIPDGDSLVWGDWVKNLKSCNSYFPALKLFSFLLPPSFLVWEVKMKFPLEIILPFLS